MRSTRSDSAAAVPTPRTARRLAAAIALAVMIATGLVVHSLLPDTAATDIAGDALYAAAAYAGIMLLLPRVAPVLVGAIALAWCATVELFQLTGVPLAVGADFPPAMLVLGTVFDARDLAVYTLSIVAATALDLGIGAARGPRRTMP